MKKLLYLLGVLVVIVLVAGCKSTPASASQRDPGQPDWAEETPPHDAFWGIGVAKLQNEGLAQQAATSRARRAVAAQLNVLVQGMLTDYAREAGTLNNASSIQFIESVGRDLINANLSGATPNATKRMPDGTWWVRVSLLERDAKNAINKAIDNEAARFADFKAQEALRQMDSRIADLTPKQPIIQRED